MAIARPPIRAALSFVGAVLLISGARAEPPASHAAGSVALRVSGSVQHPLKLTMPDLRAMPASEPSWGTDGQPHRARGVDLLTLLDRAGLRLDQTVKNQRLRFAVVATGGDGYQAVFSLGELMPSLGGKGAIAAYEQDGGPLAEREGPLKLISAGDKAPSRWIRGLAELRVVDLDSTHAPKAPSHLGP